MNIIIRMRHAIGRWVLGPDYSEMERLRSSLRDTNKSLQSVRKFNGELQNDLIEAYGDLGDAFARTTEAKTNLQSVISSLRGSAPPEDHEWDADAAAALASSVRRVSELALQLSVTDDSRNGRKLKSQLKAKMSNAIHDMLEARERVASQSVVESIPDAPDSGVLDPAEEL